MLLSHIFYPLRRQFLSGLQILVWKGDNTLFGGYVNAGGRNFTLGKPTYAIIGMARREEQSNNLDQHPEDKKNGSRCNAVPLQQIFLHIRLREHGKVHKVIIQD